MGARSRSRLERSCGSGADDLVLCMGAAVAARAAARLRKPVGCGATGGSCGNQMYNGKHSIMEPSGAVIIADQ